MSFPLSFQENIRIEKSFCVQVKLVLLIKKSVVDSWTSFVSFEAVLHLIKCVDILIQLKLVFKCVLFYQMVLKPDCRWLVGVRVKTDSFWHHWFHECLDLKGIGVRGVTCSEEVLECRFVLVLPGCKNKHSCCFRVEFWLWSKLCTISNKKKTIFSRLTCEQMRLPVANLKLAISILIDHNCCVEELC